MRPTRYRELVQTVSKLVAQRLHREEFESSIATQGGHGGPPQQFSETHTFNSAEQLPR
jgi:esterase/lipase